MLLRSTPCGIVAPATVTVISTQNQTRIETTTEIQVVTVTSQPGTVTVALEGPGAIYSSISSAISVESQQLEINSQIAPNNPLTSGHPPTATSATRFTRTIVVPVIEATKTSAASGQATATDVYFIGQSNGTTTWLSNFVPHESMTIGTTTVTLSPVPSASASRTNRTRFTEHTTRTNTMTMTVDQPNPSLPANGGSFAGPGYQGWNSSICASAFASASGCTNNGGDTNRPSSFQVVTIRRSSVVTTTLYRSSSPISQALPTDAYGSTVNITFPTAVYDHQKRSGDDPRRRAVCEWVTATMRGTPVSWPNNWDGSKTVNCATMMPYTAQSQPTLGKCGKLDCWLSRLITSPASNPVTVTITTGAPSTSKQNPLSSYVLPTHTVLDVSSTSMSTAPATSTSCGVSGAFTLDVRILGIMFGA
jgi:hypothetical protein